MNTQPHLDEALLRAAADWHVRLERPFVTQAEARAFAVWIASDERHRQAYAATGAAVREIEFLGEVPAMAAMLQTARRRLSAVESAHVPQHRMRLATAAVVLMSIVLSGGLLLTDRLVVDTEHYQSPEDRRSTVVLSDGSHLWLDANTAVEVSYSHVARTLDLQRGQARFQVARDTSRPFRVIAGKRSVVATGTDFNVERLPTRSIITVVEGRVVVVPSEANQRLAMFLRPRNPRGTELTAGARLESFERGGIALSKISAADAVAWQDDKIVFENETLASAVERINKHGEPRIVVDAPAVASVRVSGVFAVSDPSIFAGAIAQYLGLRSSEGDDGAIRLTTQADDVVSEK